MEGFYSYVDIFATKGIEYLLVLGFLAIFPIFWKVLSSMAPGETEKAVVPSLSEWFKVLPDLYYHPGHTWVALEEGNLAKVGIDDFAQKLLGTPTAIYLPPVGSFITQGEEGWKIQIDGKSIEMLSPISGEVVEVNEDILKNPGELNRNVYETWLLKVKVPKKASLKNLLKGNIVKTWMEETVERLRTRLGENLGTVYQDGGVIVSGIAKVIDPQNWDEIVREFLLLE